MNKSFIEEKIEKDIENGYGRKIHTRFPPEPNSITLHIGHAKSIILNHRISESYDGLFNIRFDDTNPSKEKEEYINGMLSDIKWLGFPTDRVFYASDYFDEMVKYAKVLINKKLAYVCELSKEEISEYKGTPTELGKDSPYRDRTINHNLLEFDKMINGGYEEGERVLRAKIDMSSPNIHMRDPILYRIKDIEHHRVSGCVYPTYDFAHCISDAIEEISHSLCTLEFESHRPLYNWILNNIEINLIPLPEQIEFNRLNIGYTILSKRKLKELVDNNIVSGWDDARMPTISGLRRRGYTPTSIRNFCEKAGWTKRDSLTDYALLEACLREELNKTSNRYMGVIDPIKLTITNWDRNVEWVTIENNPEDESAGKRTVAFSKDIYIEREDFREEANRKYFRLKIGGEVRLKGGYVVKAHDCIKDENGVITEVLCTYDPMTKSGMTMDRKVKGTIHWVSVDDSVEIEVRDYSKLFNTDRPNGIEDINPDSLITRKGFAELDILGVDNPFQFMRKGYYILDKDSSDTKLIFNKSVSLKEGW